MTSRPTRGTEERHVIAARLLPGELLNLDELGTRYGVSRTPVREALRRLEAEGLVLFREHRRVQVAPLTVNEIADTYALRILTEGFAVSESIRRRPPEIARDAEVIYRHMEGDASAGDSDAFYRHHLDFHRAIYAGAGSQELTRITEDLRTRSDRHRHAHTNFQPANLGSTVDNHTGILAAVLAADQHGAARLVVEHLYATSVELLAQAGVDRSMLLDHARTAALDGLGGTGRASGAEGGPGAGRRPDPPTAWSGRSPGPCSSACGPCCSPPPPRKRRCVSTRRPSTS